MFDKKSIAKQSNFDDRIYEGFLLFDKDRYDELDNGTKNAIVFSLAKAMFKEIGKDKFVIYYDKESKTLLPIYFLKKMKESFLDICTNEQNITFVDPSLLDFYRGIANFFIILSEGKEIEHVWPKSKEHIFLERKKNDKYEVICYDNNSIVESKTFSIKKVDSLM